jgi:glutamine synthetase
MDQAVCVEYVWIGGNNELLSKTKVMYNLTHEIQNVNELPKWNYDGSSTNQSSGTESEVIIVPRALFNDPFRGGLHKLCLCDTYRPGGSPLPNNHRVWAYKLFSEKTEVHPWFGLEQEYFLINKETNKPLGFPKNGDPEPQGQYYCSAGANNAFGRDIAEEHLWACINAGINISGINAEVAPGQWEFQIGPCVGIEEGDHLWTAR